MLSYSSLHDKESKESTESEVQNASIFANATIRPRLKEWFRRHVGCGYESENKIHNDINMYLK